MKDTNTLITELFKAGAHLGFSKTRRHPSVAPYLFTTKQGSDIFDLERTSGLLADAANFLRELGENGKVVLLVSTKEEVKDITRREADAANLPYVTNRWIGGVLTNFSEIRKRIQRLVSLKEQDASGELERKYTKMERLMLSREMDKLSFNFGGIEKIERTPDALLVVDPRHEAIAVKEATDARVPVIAILSSDCNLFKVTKPVIANDAHRESVAYVLHELIEAYLDGKSRYVPKVSKPVERRERTTTTRINPEA